MMADMVAGKDVASSSSSDEEEEDEPPPGSVIIILPDNLYKCNFDPPENNVLKVRFCDGPFSIIRVCVHPSTILLKHLL